MRPPSDLWIIMNIATRRSALDHIINSVTDHMVLSMKLAQNTSFLSILWTDNVYEPSQ